MKSEVLKTRMLELYVFSAANYIIYRVMVGTLNF